MEDAATPADGRSPAVLGRTIAGKFRIESYLGGGAMGAVYKARQIALDKDVAIKLLHGEHAGDAMFAARFQREAKAASKLDHPNSVRVLDFGQEPDGLLYIAMELLDGRDLFHVIQEDWPISTRRAADILTQALAALAVAHDMGVVHRDLKPENIMLMRGTDDEGESRDVVKVCDFGIAKFTDAPEARTTGGGQKLTTQGIVVGTPEYMSPEQGKGEVLDARSDLYAMGVILYQLLTGRVPFDAETALGVVLKHVTEDPLPPRKVNPQADPRLESICLKAMRKKREDRYQGARDMRADLRQVLGTTDPLAHAPTAQLASLGAEAHAPTALAIDSAQVAAATASKLTPAGTVTDSTPLDTRSRGRKVLAVVAALAVAAGGVVAWRTYARPSSPPVVAVDPLHAAPSAPPTTLEPIRAQNSELPPLEPVVASSAPSKPTGTPTALAPATGRTATTATNTTAPGMATMTASPPATTAAPPATTAAPPTVTVATAPPTPPPTQPAPAAAPFDPSHARVEWSVAGAGGGATPGAVQRALSRASGGWTQCYRTALARRNERAEGTGVLHLTTDEAGNVVAASVRGLDNLPAVKSCIAGSARVHIDGVDTGDAWADIQLTLRAE